MDSLVQHTDSRDGGDAHLTALQDKLTGLPISKQRRLIRVRSERLRPTGTGQPYALQRPDQRASSKGGARSCAGYHRRAPRFAVNLMALCKFSAALNTAK